MVLKIEGGDRYRGAAIEIPGESVRFVTASGKIVFEVTALPDGHSIAVRGVEVHKVGRIVYSSSLDVRPKVENEVVIINRRYPE